MANTGLGMAQSWYAATAHPAPRWPVLAGEIVADLVVVGGGATGLSAALHAAEAGMRVVLLEAGRIGWGASGRNGGQIIPGLRKGAAELVALYGVERARALFDLALAARALVLDRIERHDITCDLRLTGHLYGAVKPGQLRDFEAELRVLEDVMGYGAARLLGREAALAEVATPYQGALFDAGGGHFHTLNYTVGLARAAAAAGVVLHEDSAALALAQSAAGVVVRTAGGAVRARQAVLAGDALLSGLSARVNHRIMPVANYIVTTAPLPDAAALIPGDAAVSDARFVVNYFRRTPDNRLMFGGGERYSRKAPADIAGFVRPFLERTFPQLRGVGIEHGWGGLVSVTRSRLPDIGRDGAVLWAHGYSGQGAILSTLGGALLAEAATGVTTRFDRFAGVAPGAFPGGSALRGPLHVLGMLWYALRDRLG
ncbi:MAG: NAD(P)/FAD-dependent oxidoreductase [Polymorphobacter sp.]